MKLQPIAQRLGRLTRRVLPYLPALAVFAGAEVASATHALAATIVGDPGAGDQATGAVKSLGSNHVMPLVQALAAIGGSAGIIVSAVNPNKEQMANRLLGGCGTVAAGYGFYSLVSSGELTKLAGGGAAQAATGLLLF